MGKPYKKHNHIIPIKYVIPLEEKPMTLEELKKIENDLLRQNKIEKEGQMDFILDVIIKN